MQSPFKRWLLGLVSLFSVLAITGCAGWVGSGQVIEKEHEAGHWETKRKSDGTKSTNWVPECYELEVRDEDSGEEQEFCINKQTYDLAVENQRITITEESYK